MAERTTPIELTDDERTFIAVALGFMVAGLARRKDWNHPKLMNDVATITNKLMCATDLTYKPA